MKKILIGIMLCFCISIVQAKVTVVAEKNGYKLYSTDVSKTIELVERLADKKLSPAEKKEIRLDSIKSFKNGSNRHLTRYFKHNPSNTLKKYAKWHQMLDRINKSKTDFEYELAIQSAYHKLYYEAGSTGDLNRRKVILSIIKKYNPVFDMNTKGQFLRFSKQQFFVKKKDGYETDKNGYYLTTFMLDSIVKIAEFLSNSTLTVEEKNQIKKWTRKAFVKYPKSMTDEYAYLINELLPQIYSTTLPKHVNHKSASELVVIREQLYRKYYFELAKKGFDKGLMDIVVTLNPVLIVDNKNEALIPLSSLYTTLTKYKFLGDVVGKNIKLTEEIYLNEKNKMIKSFVNARNKKNYLSGASVSLQYREFWASYSAKKKKNRTVQMKRLYRNPDSVDSALQPIHTDMWRKIVAQQRAFLNGQFFNQMFNGFNSQHARILDDIASNTHENSSRLSLQYADVKVVDTRNNYFIVEDINRPGIKYSVLF